MCGRIVCNLDPSDIRKLCQFFNQKGNKRDPVVRNLTTDQKFQRSYNISPSQLTPILFCEKDEDLNFIDNKIIQPMRWGLIPSYNKESVDNFKLNTHNAKIETIMEKSLFRSSFNKGNRCIAIVEGFYEWNKEKKPYFYKSTKSDILYLAAIFDICKMNNGNIYSYSILTEESQGRMASIHHRSPVILHDLEEIEFWLNSENVSSLSAITLLKNRKWTDEDLEIYPVSTFVNKSSNNDPKCIVKLEKSNSLLRKSTLLTSWLKQTDNEDKLLIKKIKKEENL